MWFRAVWKASDLARRFISGLPFQLKNLCTQFIVATVYFPMAKAAALLDALRFDVSSFPLSAYRDKSFYTMRTDALNRFGTRIGKRFSKAEIEEMLRQTRLVDVRFSDKSPFWIALGCQAQA